MVNPFFLNQGPINLSSIIKILKITNLKNITEHKVRDIKDLLTSSENDITFFHSKKYKDIAKNTKASFCISTDNLKYKFTKVFNTTYAGINSLLDSSGFNKLDFRLEMTELAFVKLPNEIQKLGFTVMDGQFFSSIYYPALKCHSLTHVRYTPHIQWNERDYCIEPYKISDKKHKSKYFSYIRKAKYKKELIELQNLCRILDNRYNILIELIKFSFQIQQQNYLKIQFYLLHILLKAWMRKSLLT